MADHRCNIIPYTSKVPERIHVSSHDFIGQTSFTRVEYTGYRVVCVICGLVDKAATRPEAESRADYHKANHWRNKSR